MVTRTQAPALRDISVTNVQQSSKFADTLREIAAAWVVCSLLVGAQAVSGPHVSRIALASSFAALAGVAAVLRRKSPALPVSAIIDASDDRSCDETCRRWMAQMAGAAIAAAILARTCVAPLPVQLDTSDLVREGVAAGMLGLLVSATHHDTPNVRAAWLGGFFVLATSAGARWAGNPALVIGASLGGLTPFGTLIGPLLGVVLVGMLVGLCLPTRGHAPIAEPVS